MDGGADGADGDTQLRRVGSRRRLPILRGDNRLLQRRYRRLRTSEPARRRARAYAGTRRRRRMLGRMGSACAARRDPDDSAEKEKITQHEAPPGRAALLLKAARSPPGAFFDRRALKERPHGLAPRATAAADALRPRSTPSANDSAKRPGAARRERSEKIPQAGAPQISVQPVAFEMRPKRRYTYKGISKIFPR